MKAAALAVLLATGARATDLGGHEEPAAPQAAPAPDERRATLEEMWQRRILPPDLSSWSPRDLELLGKIRRNEDDALRLLREKHGGYRPWVARPRGGSGLARLTKEGYERYVAELTQDAIAYFESKGAEARWIFKLQDLDGRALFDEDGRINEDGARLYRRAKLKLEAFWRAPDGTVFGTRRPPAPAAKKP